MIKKIITYGLCFNLSVAFGYPTQAKLEAFLETQGTGIEVKRNVLGFPEEIALKNEATKKAWQDFLASPEIWEEDVTPCESTSLPQTREVPQEKERPVYTNEERRVCFEKYSREATPEEFAWIDKLQIKGLRIVDFNSIVNGLNDVQKAEVLDLAKNEDKLFGAIDRLVEEGFPKEIVIWSSVTSLNTEGLADRFDYLLDPKITEKAKEHLKTALKNIVHYEKPRETLALFLALFKHLSFFISEVTQYQPSPWSDNIELHFYEDESKTIQALYHALNSAIHNYLGIEAYYSLLGEMDSILERDLFRLGKLPLNTGSFKISSDLLFSLMNGYSGFETPDEFVEIPQQKFYRAVQLSLLWRNLEEIWLSIGFANIDDVLYINRTSDINFIKAPFLFREGRCDFSHPHFLGGFWLFDLSSHPFVTLFLKDLETTVKKDIFSLCPTDEAWQVWLHLQGRTDVDGKNYFIRINTAQKEIGSQKIEQTGTIIEVNHCSSQLDLEDLINLPISEITAERIINARGKNGETLLHRLALIGDINRLKELLDKLEPQQAAEIIKIQNILGYTSLHFAANKGYTEIVKVLLDKLDPQQAAEIIKIYNGILLLSAIKEGYPEIVKVALSVLTSQEVFNIINIQEVCGDTPLYLAVVNGHTEIVKALLDKLDPLQTAEIIKIRIVLRDTVLHFAVKKGNAEIVKALLDKLIPQDAVEIIKNQDSFGKMSLYMAAEKEDTEILKVLLDKLTPQDATEIIKIQDHFGKTLLCWAVEKENIVIVKALLDKLASQNATEIIKIQDHFGRTSLCWAIEKGNIEIVKALLDKLASQDAAEIIKIQDRFGKTLLHAVAEKGNIETVKTLLDKLTPQDAAETIKIQDRFGKTLLYWAVEKENIVIVKILLDKLDSLQTAEIIKIQDCFGKTLLHGVAEKGNIETVKTLLDKLTPQDAAEITKIQDCFGRTVERAGNQEIVSLLKEKLAKK